MRGNPPAGLPRVNASRLSHTIKAIKLTSIRLNHYTDSHDIENHYSIHTCISCVLSCDVFVSRNIPALDCFPFMQHREFFYDQSLLVTIIFFTACPLTTAMPHSTCPMLTASPCSLNLRKTNCLQEVSHMYDICTSQTHNVHQKHC